MTYLISIEEKTDFDWLAGLINNAKVKIRRNPAVYDIEWVEHVEAVSKAFDNVFVGTVKLEGRSGPVVEKKKRAPKGSKIYPNLCPTHKNYGAKRRPSTDCKGCWAAYEKYNGKAAAEQARKKFVRANKG